MGKLLINLTMPRYQKAYAFGALPEELVDEMRGIVDGAKSANSKTEVTWERVVTVNYGFDSLMAIFYTGHIKSEVKAVQAIPGLFTAAENDMITDWFLNYQRRLDQGLIEGSTGVFCDAFGATGQALRDPSAAGFFARDFQLPTCHIFNDISIQIIQVPTDQNRHAVINAGVPGLVGAISIMNEHGVSVGVDVLRSNACNSSMVGLGSALLIRHIADHAKTLAEAIELAANAVRGVAWLYPVCDGTGDCAVLEAARSQADVWDPMSFIRNKTIKPLLPDTSWFEQHSSNEYFRNGLYVRFANYSFPESVLDFNENLFDVANFPYNASAWAATGALFKNWTIEAESAKSVEMNYFPPQREDFDEIVICSNSAVIPEFRMTQMSLFDKLLAVTQAAPQYRYDCLNNMLTESFGMIDFDEAVSIITWLSPDRTPGYWEHNLVDPLDPMTAEIEGLISVVDLGKRIMMMKTGYWCDSFTTISLLEYLD
jgi:hypothetical protein